MPRGFMDDLEGEICDEELCECALGNDILSADLNGEDALLTNIGELHDLVGESQLGLVQCVRDQLPRTSVA